jgi:hypothetical protein
MSRDSSFQIVLLKVGFKLFFSKLNSDCSFQSWKKSQICNGCTSFCERQKTNTCTELYPKAQRIIPHPAVNDAASLPSLPTFTNIEHSPLPLRTLHVLSKVQLRAKGWREAYFWFENMPQGKCLSFLLRIGAKADNPARQVCLEGKFSKHLERAEVLALRAFKAADMAIGSRSASYLNLMQRTAHHSMQHPPVLCQPPLALATFHQLIVHPLQCCIKHHRNLQLQSD